MDKFLSWDGWAGVSAIAQIVALVTLIAGFARFIALRRQVPLFRFSWDFIGTHEVDGHEYHLVEFRNVGRGAGEFMDIHIIGADVLRIEGFIPPTVLGSGESFRALLTSRDLSQAWIRWIWRTQNHESRWFVRWAPAVRSGAMQEQWKLDVERWLWRSTYDIARHRFKPRYVGPGGAPAGMASGPNGGDRLASMMLGGDLEAIVTHILFRQGTPQALPYVSPPAAESA
ncbi:hypothetical protein LJR044_002488 [Microbacterium foliorum]